MTNALGRHILVEFFDCNPSILNDSALIEYSMLEAAKAAQATIINSTFHHFSPIGVSGVVVIQESHLAIHTWPEYGYAAVDIFTCGQTISPWVAYDVLKKAFEASNGSAIEINRGQVDLLKTYPVDFGTDHSTFGAANQFEKSNWLIDKVGNISLGLRYSEVLYRQQSPYQLVQVLKSPEYGNILTVDSMVMCTEKDEFIYHEMISHPAMLTHPAAKQILVIGAGDGGTIRELLKHPQVEQITMVEIDALVVEASKQFLPSIASQFDNPKLKLIIADGIDFVAKAAAESYDLVIVDGSDPVGPAEGLFSHRFFEDIKRVLKPDGLLTLQSESPHCNQKAFVELHQCLGGIFGQERTHCYLVNIPTYPSGTWSFHYVAKGELHPTQQLDEQKIAEFAEKHDLGYYNLDIHRAAFALPNFVKKMLRAPIRTLAASLAI